MSSTELPHQVAIFGGVGDKIFERGSRGSVINQTRSY